MSNTKTLDKAIEHALAAGIMLPCLEELLMNDELPRELVAKSLYNVISTTDGLPDGLLQLQAKLKQKYNL